MEPFALVLRPEEAAAIIADWPDNGWLVACHDADGRRWEIGLEADVPCLVGRLPVWPPADGFQLADVCAEDEADFIRHLTAVPDIGRDARDRLAKPPREIEDDGLSASQISWDD